jgi:hypothetical protein
MTQICQLLGVFLGSDYLQGELAVALKGVTSQEDLSQASLP